MNNIFKIIVTIIVGLIVVSFTFNHINPWIGLLLTGVSIYLLLKFMKKVLFVVLAVITLSSCSRVAPNYQGVLMENFGQNGKSDFSLVKGRVWTLAPGKELFQVPLFEQRGGFEVPLELKASNNTEFKATPKYSYQAEEDKAVDVVFDSKRLDSGGDDMMDAIEDNILEPRIDDLIKEFSRAYHTDTLMATGGQLKFEQALQDKVAEVFKEKGFKLLTFQAQLEFTAKVKNKIDNRNEVNTNISVIESQIEEQKKRNELESLKTEQMLIKSRGLTKEVLMQRFIDKWSGSAPLYGTEQLYLLKDVK